MIFRKQRMEKQRKQLEQEVEVSEKPSTSKARSGSTYADDEAMIGAIDGVEIDASVIAEQHRIHELVQQRRQQKQQERLDRELAVRLARELNLDAPENLYVIKRILEM